MVAAAAGGSPVVGSNTFLKGFDFLFFYLPDPLTMQNMSFKHQRGVMQGETINIAPI